MFPELLFCLTVKQLNVTKGRRRSRGLVVVKILTLDECLGEETGVSGVQVGPPVPNN